jgi:hypothetical protein
VQKRLAGEAVAGPISNVTADQFLNKSNKPDGNFLSEEENEFLFGLGGGSPKHQNPPPKQENKFAFQSDDTTTTTADTTPNLSSLLSNDKEKPSNPITTNEFKTYTASSYNPSLPGSLISNNYSSINQQSSTSQSSYHVPQKGSSIVANQNDEFQFNSRNNDDSLFQDSMFSDANSVNR